MKYSYAEFAPLLKIIADETRLKIIEMLSHGTLCACDILENLEITQSTLSYHMKLLSESGIVTAERDGAWMRYTLNRNRSTEILDFITSITAEKEPLPLCRSDKTNCCCK